MQDLLYSYLIQNGSLTLPGIGTVNIKKQPAQSDFVNHQILPPSVAVQLDTTSQQIRNDLFNYIAQQKNVEQVDAIRILNEFSFNLKNEMKEHAYEWKGIGTFNETADGSYELSSNGIKFDFLEPVRTERVIHQHTEHYIKVGDKEKTNTQMAEWLHERETGKKSSWVLAALIISILATGMFALNYLKILPSLSTPKEDVPVVSVNLE